MIENQVSSLIAVSFSKQRVDMAKGGNAHIATRDELIQAVYLAAWTDMKKENSSCGLSGALGSSPKAQP